MRRAHCVGLALVVIALVPLCSAQPPVAASAPPVADPAANVAIARNSERAASSSRRGKGAGMGSGRQSALSTSSANSNISTATNSSVAGPVTSAGTVAADASAASSNASAAVTTAAYRFRYLRLYIMGVREKNTRIVQLAEWRIFDDKGAPLTAPPLQWKLTNPTGTNPPQEGPGNLVNGKRDDKWLQFDFTSRADVLLDMVEPQAISAVQFITANDAPNRDPDAVVIAASNDTTSWTVLLDRALNLTESRHAESARYPLAPLEVRSVPEKYSPRETTVGTQFTLMFSGGGSVGDEVKFVQSTRNCSAAGFVTTTEGVPKHPAARVTFNSSGLFHVCYRAGKEGEFVLTLPADGPNLKVNKKPKTTVHITIVN